MAIQQPESPVGRSETFPANENSSFPNKSTTNAIVIMCIVVAAVVAIFAMMSPKVGPGNEMKTTPTMNTMPIRQSAAPNGTAEQQPPAK